MTKKFLAREGLQFFVRRKFSLKTWLFSFAALLGGSVFMQNFLANLETKPAETFVLEVLQPFYLILLLAMVLVFYFLTKESLGFLANLVLWSMWLTLTRPFIDRLILGKEYYLSFYVFDGPVGLMHRFVTYFGPIDRVGILYGTRIELVLILIFTLVFLRLKKVSWARSLLGVGLVYLIFYLICALPSFLTIPLALAEGKSFWEISRLDVAKHFSSPLSFLGGNYHGFSSALFYKTGLVYNLILLGLLLIIQKIKSTRELVALVKNIRYPQALFTVGMLLAGMGAASFYYPDNLTFDFFSILAVINLLLAIFFAWQFSVVINDEEDVAVDQISNVKRPLVQKVFTREQFRDYGLVFLVLAWLFSVTVGGKYFVIILLYNLLTWVYSKYPFRIKRVAVLASAVAAWAIFLVFLLGWMLMADDQALTFFPYRAAIFLFLVATFSIPLKDLKDREGDGKMGAYTWPVLIGNEKTRQLVGWVLFLAHPVSSFIFHQKQLFWVALFFGLANFWLLTNQKIAERKIMSAILPLAFVYALLILWQVLKS